VINTDDPSALNATKPSMETSIEGDARPSLQADYPHKTRKSSALGLTFASPLPYKANSSASVYTLRSDSAVAESEAIEDGDALATRIRPTIKRRSQSEDVTPRVREQWGKELWEQGPLKDSMVLLRASVADYEKEASQQQWKDLLKINADVANLGQLMEGTRKTKSKKGRDDDDVDGLTKFTTVALEYSKMLDVVMNQAPEYAGLAWGVSLKQALEENCSPSYRSFECCS
jgi:hypothetical protein